MLGYPHDFVDLLDFYPCHCDPLDLMTYSISNAQLVTFWIFL